MLKMNKLQRCARESAELRNHKLDTFETINSHLTRAICTICGKEVDCNTRPLPNEISVGGEAVAVGCTADRDFHYGRKGN